MWWPRPVVSAEKLKNEKRTMRPPNPKISISMVLLAAALMAAPTSAAEATPDGARDNTTTSSPWLRKLTKAPRERGCWGQPWVCHDRAPSFRRMLCCRNRCVDLDFDDNDCGFCGIRCPFSRRCCKGFCVDTNLNPFHCGGCFNRCPPFVPCFHGMCGYALPHHPPPKQPGGGKHPPPGGGASASS